MKLTTSADVQAEIIGAIEAGEASRDDYDLDQIADRAYEYSTDLQAFVQTVDAEGFWAIVEEAAL